MTAPKNKPLPPEWLARFVAYNRVHPGWGSLHIVLGDDNINDHSVRYCLEYARDSGDLEGMLLSHVLLGLSKTQRLKVGDMVSDILRAEYLRESVVVVPTPTPIAESLARAWHWKQP